MNTRMSLLQRGQDRNGIDDTQNALLNILEDLTAEQSGFEAAQRALLNILDDADAEKLNLQEAQRAVLNILEDSEAEKANLQGAQSAVLNILEDFDVEKSKVQLINQELQKEIEERRRAEGEVRRLNRELEQHTAELTAANRELEAFAYSVSHDLRAPVRHVNAFADSLRKRLYEKLDERERHYLDTIATSSRQMGALIDDLLNFSRLGRAGMSKSQIALQPLVHEVRKELESETAGRTVAWQVASLPQVYADPALLRQVLVNLLSNAVKYTRGRSEARIEVGSRNGTPGERVVFVRDNGVGFEMEYVHKLFKVFQRLHTEHFEGTGIGLANVRRIIERHGGRVWAEGVPGKGATFYFSIPAQGGTVDG